MARARIVILGGGFGGVQCAKTLRRLLPPERTEVVLFNQENHLVFSPLLAEVVGSSLNPLDVVVPLRELLPGVACRTEEVRAVDLAANQVEFEGHDGRARRMDYDQLVIACGSAANLNVVPGMADHAFALKSVGDAFALRSHILQQLERAEVCDDPEAKTAYLSFLVVGGGFSGVEVAGEVNDLVRGSLRMFTRIEPEEVNVTLVHSRDQILPEIGAELREFARREMEESGVRLVLNARVQRVTSDGVVLGEGRFLRGETIVCTIGATAAPVVERLDAPKEKGRLLTDADMRLRGSANVWAIGDCAQILNAYDGQPAPTSGQFAERQGRQVAENITRVFDEAPTQPFHFKPLGQLCSIGGRNAVAEIFGQQWAGFWAWFIWRGVYLFKMPSWSRRFQVGFDWAWLLLFPRDLSHLRARTTDRVTRAHFEPGDFIFRRGDPPSNFYVIEQGEVELLRAVPEVSGGQKVSVLGPGAFFGEKALLNDEPRQADARARSPVQVLVMGKNVFAQVSRALVPFRDALAQTLNRRALEAWKDQPHADALLGRTPLKQLMEPPPLPLLPPTSTLREVSRAFAEHTHDCFYISADGQRLDGLITMTDLMRAQASGAIGTTPVSEFMARQPVALCEDDTASAAARALRTYRLKSLPVVTRGAEQRVMGRVRARRLIAFVLEHAEGEVQSPKTQTSK